MTRLPSRFTEDRALRDAARAVLTEDVERLRASLAEQGIASRVSSGVTSTVSARIRTGARDIFEEVKTQAGDRKGVLGVLIGAIILWFARGPILEWFEELLGDSSDDETPPDTTGSPAPAPDGDSA